jgi:hypothetical protein
MTIVGKTHAGSPYGQVDCIPSGFGMGDDGTMNQLELAVRLMPT